MKKEGGNRKPRMQIDGKSYTDYDFQLPYRTVEPKKILIFVLVKYGTVKHSEACIADEEKRLILFKSTFTQHPCCCVILKMMLLVHQVILRQKITVFCGVLQSILLGHKY